MTRVLFNRISQNVKTGRIPTAMSSKSTCPESCPLLRNGCYANSGAGNVHWDRLTRGETGIEFHDFLKQIRNLPPGTLWRYGTAGDLPGDGDYIDPSEFIDLVNANIGRRGFTFTHKRRTGRNLTLIRAANANGFTVNISANSPRDADEAADLHSGPVATLVTKNTPPLSKTPAGRKIVVCPAQYKDSVTCKSCRMCAIADRDFIIGFRAHGSGRANGGEKVNQMILADGEQKCSEF